MSNTSQRCSVSEYRATYPQLLSLKQAAQIVQRPIKTIYMWSHEGLFDSFKRKLGREIRLERDRFLELIDKGF